MSGKAVVWFAVLASATFERIGQRLKESLPLPKPSNLRKPSFVKTGETSLELEKNVLGNVTVGRKRDGDIAFAALLQNLQRGIGVGTRFSKASSVQFDHHIARKNRVEGVINV